MSDRARDRVIRVALTIWVGTFIAFLGTSVTTFNEPLRTVGFWGYGMPIVLAAAYGLSRRVTPLDVAVFVAIAAFLAVSLLSTDRIASLESAGLAIAYASTFIVAARVRSAKWRSPIAVGVALPVTVWMIVLAVVWTADRIEWVALGGGFPPHIAKSAHMWLGTDLVAVLLLLAVPFYPWIGWTALRRTLIAVTVLAAFAIVPMSDARTTWIAAVIGLAAFAALTSGLRSRLWPAYRLPLLLGGGLLLLAAGAIVVTGAIGTLSGRTNIWTTAMATFASSPLAGTGPGTFSWERLSATPPLLEPYAIFQAHNIVLQTLADGGLLLLVGLAVACAVWLITVGPAAFSLDHRTRLGLAVLVSLVVVLLFDDPLQLPALAAMALILAGWVATDARQPASSRPRRRRLGWAGTIALLAAAVVTVPSVFAASEARSAAAQGRAAAVEGEWDAAHRAFTLAADAWPARAAYELGLGLASSHLGDEAEARDHYESAVRLSPGDPRPYGALAALTDDPEQQIDLLERASRLMARDPQYRYRLAVALIRAGRDVDAVRELARAAAIDPQVLTVIDQEWDPVILASVLQVLPEVLSAEAELMAVDPVSVMAQADVVRERIDAANPPALVALAASRAGDDALAATWLHRALQAEPFDQRTYDVGVAVAEVRCDEEETRRLRRLGEIAPGGFTSLYRIGEEIREARDHIYREMGLGDYQPPDVDRPPVSPYEWPRAFLAGIGCVPEADRP